MPKSSVPRPTDAELAILRVLWERGPATVRQVHEVMAAGRSLAYTTTLKLLQIMTEKGLTVRELRGEDGRTHIYKVCHREEDMQRLLVDDLLHRAFGGSAAKLVMQALESKPASAAERKEIRRMLTDRLRKEKNDD